MRADHTLLHRPALERDRGGTSINTSLMQAVQLEPTGSTCDMRLPLLAVEGFIGGGRDTIHMTRNTRTRTSDQTDTSTFARKTVRDDVPGNTSFVATPDVIRINPTRAGI